MQAYLLQSQLQVRQSLKVFSALKEVRQQKMQTEIPSIALKVEMEKVRGVHKASKVLVEVQAQEPVAVLVAVQVAVLVHPCPCESTSPRPRRKSKNPVDTGFLSGAEGRNRTGHTMIFSHVLYQLSYLGKARLERRI